MREEREATSFAVLFFPKSEKDTHIMYVSDPPPLWLGSENLTKVVVEKAGIYCLFFLARSARGGKAYITVNGKEVRGSYSKEKEGEISGSAVCSIREAALPCTLGIKTEDGGGGGFFVVADCDI